MTSDELYGSVLTMTMANCWCICRFLSADSKCSACYSLLTQKFASLLYDFHQFPVSKFSVYTVLIDSPVIQVGQCTWLLIVRVLSRGLVPSSYCEVKLLSRYLSRSMSYHLVAQGKEHKESNLSPSSHSDNLRREAVPRWRSKMITFHHSFLLLNSWIYFWW